jgi:hypothetical protein
VSENVNINTSPIEVQVETAPVQVDIIVDAQIEVNTSPVNVEVNTSPIDVTVESQNVEVNVNIQPVDVEIYDGGFTQVTGVGSITGNVVDNTNPNAPVVTAVASVTGDGVDNTDPQNPVLSWPPASSLNDLTDVTISAPANGEVLKYNGSEWVNGTVSSIPSTLDDLTDVTISSNTAGEILKWNGSLWINNTLAEAGIQPAGTYGTVTSVGLTVGTAGTDIAVAGSPITTNGSFTLDIPTASATNRGALSSADWSTFNNKQATGLSWLLASGGTLTADNTLSGSFGIGFGAAPPASNKFLVRGLGTTTGELVRCENSAGTRLFYILDSGYTNILNGNFRFTDANYFEIGNNISISASINEGSSAGGNGGTMVITAAGTQDGSNFFLCDTGLSLQSVTGFQKYLRLGSTSGALAPTASDSNWAWIYMKEGVVYNASGSWSGVIHGYYYNPTVTALSNGKHYAMVTSSGLHGFGTLAPTHQVEVYGTAANQDLFVVKENGGTKLFEARESGGVNQLGFFGVTPAARPSTYTASNVTTDRSYDANATTLDEVADVLGTLISDLQSLGLIS